MMDYRERYRQQLAQSGLIEIQQRYIEEMEEFIKTSHIEMGGGESSHEWLDRLQARREVDPESFDEFSVLWEEYKAQAEDMAIIMCEWINNQYSVYLALKKEWQLHDTK